MKKLLLLLIACSITTFAVAKKLKFSVDMSAQVVSPNGVHVMGDFQILAGYAKDWDPGLTKMVQEGSTSIYSVTVDIPAFTMYQYRYINGDLGYEAEFVPYYSRLQDPDFDNRWIYVDSLDNGTMDIGAILYEKNAPAGKFLLRFKVDMTKQFPATDRPHVEGSFQSWSPTATALYAINDTLYQYIAYVNAGTYQFKYINGNTTTKEETVPSACATSGNRSVVVSADIVLDPVCFSFCKSCENVNGIFEQTPVKTLNIFPNPSDEYTILQFNDAEPTHTVSIMDITGKIVRTYENYTNVELRIDKEQLNAGLYFISSTDSKKNRSVTKWIVQ
jgi:alpha-amylase